MERLTKIDGIGQNDLIRCFDCDEQKAGPNFENCGLCEDVWRKALDRLAAYEDTGLEPEDFKRAFTEATLLKLPAQYLGTSPERLRELAKADRDSRLVVLPCKVGDTVYFLLEDSPVYYPETNGWYISAEKITAVSTQGFFTGPIEQIDSLSFFSYDEFGKTVFLTEEQAKAALEAQQGANK